jgi:Tol biopolymer transport system component
LLVATPTVAQSPERGPRPVCRSTEPRPVAGPSHPGDGVPDPSGRIAYATVGRFDPAFGPIGTKLYLIDPDGSDHVLLLDCDASPREWSPDGSRLALTILLEDGSWQVATIAADGTDLRILTSGPGIHEIPTWSVDSTWLAYDGSDVGLEDPSFRTTLRRVGADGSGAALLGEADTFDVEPRISPDGAQITFARLHPDADWAPEFLVREIASGAERAVTQIGDQFEHPGWSPDGTSLLFNAIDGSPAEGTVYTLDLVRPDAEPVAVLDPSDGWAGVKPVYSPDGSRIVFACHRTGGQDEGICTMSADGSDVTTLVDDPMAPENFPVWGRAAR